MAYRQITGRAIQDGSVVLADLAAGITVGGTFIRESQTATGGQTVFNLSNSYTVGLNNLIVYINGVRQFNTAYTETNSSRVTFSSGLTAGDIVLFEIGIVSTGSTLPAASVTFSPITGNAATDAQTAIANAATKAGANTFTNAQVFSDQTISQAMVKDFGLTVVDKGNISNATVTFDYSAGSVQTYTATGSTVTWAVSNWPPTGNEGYLLIRATNQGAYTLAATLVTNWIKPDGTTTGTMATYLAANTGRTALQSAGVDQILLWTRDAGTTVYGKLV